MVGVATRWWRGLAALGLVGALLATGSRAHAKKEEPSWVTPMPSLYGATGLLRVLGADAGQAGTFRLQLIGEAFHAREFLATSPADTNTRFGSRLIVGWSPLETLELFAMLQGSVNDNSRGSPQTVKIFGDVLVGIKGCVHLGKSFCLGAEGAALFLTGSFEGTYTIRSTSFLLRLLLTADLPSIASRLHFNVGGIIDNSDALLTPAVDPINRFAYRLNEASRLFLGLGFELLPNRLVSPFVEYSLEVPVGELPASNVPNPPGASAFPQRISAGARFFPYRALSLLAAVEIGIAWNSRLGLPAVPPWQVIFGVGYSFGTKPRTPAPVKSEDDDDF